MRLTRKYFHADIIGSSTVLKYIMFLYHVVLTHGDIN